MNFPWIRSKAASLTELREQLAGATAAHETATEAVRGALIAFDEVGSDKAAAALVKAREGAAVTLEHVHRATRLLEAAEGAERQARLEARLRELEALEATIEPTRVTAEADPLAQREAHLLVELAKSRVERVRVRREAQTRVRQAEQMALELRGEEPAFLSRDAFTDVTSFDLVRAHFDLSEVREEDHDAVREQLRRLEKGVLWAD